MGMLDTFSYVCPDCDKETSSQTKLGECMMDDLTIGCSFDMDGKIEMKDKCHNCRSRNMVVVEDKKIMAFIKSKNPTIIEGLFGSYEEVEDL